MEFSDPGGTTIALLALRESEMESAELSETVSDRLAVTPDPDVGNTFLTPNL